MCTEQVPELNWPRDLYRGAINRQVTDRQPENGFLEDADVTAQSERLSLGGGKSSIVRFLYGGRDSNLT
jgi:hypothetical protein